MITADTLRRLQEKEVFSSETPDEEYQRLGIDRQNCWDAYIQVEPNPRVVAAMLGGLCMGLELAQEHRDHHPTQSDDDFLSSLPENHERPA